MRILPGTTDLWRFLANRFGWSFELLQQLLPTVFGLLAGVLILALVAAAVFIGARKKKGPFAFGYAALLVLLVVGTLLSPTPMMSGSSLPTDCGLDVIASHEVAGAHLADPTGLVAHGQVHNVHSDGWFRGIFLRVIDGQRPSQKRIVGPGQANHDELAGQDRRGHFRATEPEPVGIAGQWDMLLDGHGFVPGAIGITRAEMGFIHAQFSFAWLPARGAAALRFLQG